PTLLRVVLVLNALSTTLLLSYSHSTLASIFFVFSSAAAASNIIYTLSLHDALPISSLAVAVTSVVPTGNNVPGSWLYVMVTSPPHLTTTLLNTIPIEPQYPDFFFTTISPRNVTSVD